MRVPIKLKQVGGDDCQIGALLQGIMKIPQGKYGLVAVSENDRVLRQGLHGVCAKQFGALILGGIHHWPAADGKDGEPECKKDQHSNLDAASVLARGLEQPANPQADPDGKGKKNGQQVNIRIK